ncbi:MAG TPA: NADP-dependent oxidoreductase [Alphaproteobacteria bacterium]|nr:NADP-dependent oxidoreductase [Alphaproteobacteria bacterium]
MWQRWVLARRPVGVPGPQDFRLDEGALPDPGENEMLVRTDYISIDPGMRSRLSRDSYAPALPLDSVIESAGIGTVIASRNTKFREGDWVSGAIGWQSHVMSSGRGLTKLNPALFTGLVRPTAAIGILGIPGLTAYFGLRDLGAPKPGQTLLVSSAAGTVGATALQIGKLDGLTVVGIAGGPDKTAYVRSLGADTVIDYKASRDLPSQLAQAIPQGVDIYFDNVGAATLDAAIRVMNLRGRIIVSGQIAEYNAAAPAGIRNTLDFIPKRLRMEGLVVFDYAARFAEAQAEMAQWIQDGKLTYREHIVPGLGQAPSAFVSLFSGEMTGRVLVKVSES